MRSLWVACLALIFTGCATTSKNPAEALQSSEKPAWSLEASQDEMIVAASPMGKTLRLAGSTGLIIGTGVDMVVNSEYRSDIRNALAGYDPGEVFRAQVERRVGETLPRGAEPVAPMQSSAGYANPAEARKARYAAMARRGFDTLLDLEMRYGLYGTEAELVTELDADLVSLPDGHRLWSTTVFANPRPALASDRLGDPQRKKRGRESAPRFSVDKTVFERWTANQGALLREEFENAVAGVTSALLTQLGGAPDAVGELYLAKVAMSRKEFQEANDHFDRALRIDPTLVEARSAQSVNYAHAGQTEDAIDLATALTRSNPEYAPVWYNLAWWYAIDLRKPAEAKPFYEEALRLGMPPDAKLEKALASS